MRYSIEPRDRTYVKGYVFLSFAKKMGTHLSNKYATDAIKTTSKRALQKTAEAIGDLTGNKTAYKITSVAKKSTKKLPNDETEADRSTLKDASEASLKYQKKDTSPEERQQVIDELRSV